jgi:hypothetical protein
MEAATGAEWSDGQLQHQPKRREREEAGIVRLEQNMKSKNSFFSLFFDFQPSHTPLLDFLIARRALLSSPL